METADVQMDYASETAMGHDIPSLLSLIRAVHVVLTVSAPARMLRGATSISKARNEFMHYYAALHNRGSPPIV